MKYAFRGIKRQFGFGKVRYRDMKKSTAQLKTLFTLSNLWMTRKKLMALAKMRCRIERDNKDLKQSALQNRCGPHERSFSGVNLASEIP